MLFKETWRQLSQFKVGIFLLKNIYYIVKIIFNKINKAYIKF